MKEPVRKTLLPPYGQKNRVGISTVPEAPLAFCPPASVSDEYIWPNIPRDEKHWIWCNTEFCGIAAQESFPMPVTLASESNNHLLPRCSSSSGGLMKIPEEEGHIPFRKRQPAAQNSETRPKPSSEPLSPRTADAANPPRGTLNQSTHTCRRVKPQQHIWQQLRPQKQCAGKSSGKIPTSLNQKPEAHPQFKQTPTYRAFDPPNPLLPPIPTQPSFGNPKLTREKCGNGGDSQP